MQAAVRTALISNSPLVLAGLKTGLELRGDFEIVRSLRSGGMGTVYVALQKSTGKQRALKLMLPGLVADAELRRR